jgi:hypothetical protein
MAGPSLSIRFVDPQPVQSTAGIGLESVHNSFRTRVCLYNRVNMVCANMCGPEAPAAVQTDFSEGIEHGHSSCLIKEIRGLVHLPALRRETLGTRCRQPAAEKIVFPIDRARFVTMQV